MEIAVLITQAMSNIALSPIMVPLPVTLAIAQGQPVGTYAVPVAIACLLSFMFPLADLTLVMAYGTGYVKIKEILKPSISSGCNRNHPNNNCNALTISKIIPWIGY